MAKKHTEHSFTLNYVTNELGNILAEMFAEYGEDVSERANKVTKEIAEDFAKKLKSETPRSGYPGENLADAVQVTEGKEKSYGRIGKTYTVHYDKDGSQRWRIAHLLEFGWTARNGKRIDRKPFVRTLFDNNRERYYKMYKDELSK